MNDALRWFRYTVARRNALQIHELAFALELPRTEVVGLDCMLMCALHENHLDGNIRALSARVVECWVEWRGAPGLYYEQLLRIACDPQGTLFGWQRENVEPQRESVRAYEAERKRDQRRRQKELTQSSTDTSGAVGQLADGQLPWDAVPDNVPECPCMYVYSAAKHREVASGPNGSTAQQQRSERSRSWRAANRQPGSDYF